MTGETQETSTSNDSRKMVPESDLIAMKKGLEGEVATLKQQMEEAKKTADTHYQTILSERASREAAERKVQEIQPTASQLESTRAELATAKTSSEQLSKQLLDLHRNRLEEVYKVPKTSLEGKTTRELEIMEEALKLTGARGATGIITGGNSSSTVQKSAREKIQSGLAARRTTN